MHFSRAKYYKKNIKRCKAKDGKQAVLFDHTGLAVWKKLRQVMAFLTCPKLTQLNIQTSI